MYEHPVVQEYLRAYEGIMNFKDNLARCFEEKGRFIRTKTIFKKFIYFLCAKHLHDIVIKDCFSIWLM